MDSEQALGMSLDDIINNQKKQKPLGSNKSKVSTSRFTLSQFKIIRQQQQQQRKFDCSTNVCV